MIFSALSRPYLWIFPMHVEMFQPTFHYCRHPFLGEIPQRVFLDFGTEIFFHFRLPMFLLLFHFQLWSMFKLRAKKQSCDHPLFKNIRVCESEVKNSKQNWQNSKKTRSKFGFSSKKTRFKKIASPLNRFAYIFVVI